MVEVQNIRTEITNNDQDYNEDYDLVQDRMIRVGEDYQLFYEDRDTNHHYEDIYNYIVDGYIASL